MTLAPHGDFTVTHLGEGGLSADTFVWGFGASMGIIDDLSVEVVPVSIYHAVASVDTPFGTFSADDTDYHYFMAGATYRFLEGDVDMGARFRFAIDSSPNIYFNPGFLVRLRGEVVRLDTGLEMMLLVHDYGSLVAHDDVVFGFGGFGQHVSTPRAGVPVELALQLADPIYLGLNTGLGIGDITEPGDSIFMPLGWGAGATIESDGQPVVDIDAGFSFPLFLLGALEDQPLEELWQLGFKGTGYIDL